MSFTSTTKQISNRTRKFWKIKKLTNVCRNLTSLEEKRGQFLQGKKKACSQYVIGVPDNVPLVLEAR